MQAELAFPISVMAAAEASEAKQLAERAEMQAFVNGYSHVSASPSERARYVEIVKTMYPQQERREEISPMAARIVGGIIVLGFLAVGIGALYGHLRLSSVEEGIYSAFVAIAVTIMVSILAGFFFFGVGLLMGYGT